MDSKRRAATEKLETTRLENEFWNTSQIKNSLVTENSSI
jgi:hypothetical protein